MPDGKLHYISALVEDKPGVMFRVTWLIRRRAFNIDSIAVGPTEHEGVSRLTMTIRGDEKVVEQVIKQLAKLVDVIKISETDPAESVIRELALVKVHVKDHTARNDIIQYVNIFRGRVVDVSPRSMIIEIVGDEDKVNAFVNLMKEFGIEELAKTGVVAMSRGVKSVKIRSDVLG